jgi:hypothetical protein|tara:strand:- start:587 stop:790 length:204 start_codon:yes stop_codon:yes gene_type:complete
LTVEVPKGTIGIPSMKHRGRSMAPEVANYCCKEKLQRAQPDFMKRILTERKGSTGAAGTVSPREGSG